MRTVILCSVCISLFLCGHCWASVLQVGEDKPYQTIREAVWAGSPGDTVLVYAGIYVEADLPVKKRMTLAASGQGRTVIVYNPWMSQGNILGCPDGSVIQGFWLVGAPDCAVLGPGEVTFRLQNCVFWGNGRVIGRHYPGWHAIITNCTVFANRKGIVCENGSTATLRNTIIWGNTSNLVGDVSASYCDIEGGWPGEGNIDADPMFVDPQQPDLWTLLRVPSVDPVRGNLRLKQGSPCIDVGDNKAANFLETDIAGNPRVMFGGKSLTVDMGVYEYYINRLQPGPGVDDTTLTWSCFAGKTYSIFWSDDLISWYLADDAVLSASFETTSWIDDGSKTGVPPSLAPRRFYRILENP